MYDIPVQVRNGSSTGVWTTVSCNAAIPAISTFGIFGVCSGNGGTAIAAYGVWLRPTGSTWKTTTSPEAAIIYAGNETAVLRFVAGQGVCMTNSSQSIDFVNLYGASAPYLRIDVEGFELNIR